MKPTIFMQFTPPHLNKPCIIFWGCWSLANWKKAMLMKLEGCFLVNYVVIVSFLMHVDQWGQVFMVYVIEDVCVTDYERVCTHLSHILSLSYAYGCLAYLRRILCPYTYTYQLFDHWDVDVPDLQFWLHACLSHAFLCRFVVAPILETASLLWGRGLWPCLSIGYWNLPLGLLIDDSNSHPCSS